MGQQFQPGGGRFGGGGGKGGKGGMDPNKIFDDRAKGRSYVVPSDFSMFRDPLTQFAKDNNIADGKITREQFSRFMDKFSKGEFQKSPGGAPGGGGSFGGGKGEDKGIALPAGVAPTAANIDQFAEEEFKRRDANGDGKLNPDEMLPQLARQIDQYDSNKDGFIDLAEFKTYFTHRMQGNDNDPNGKQGPRETINIVANLIIEDAELDRRATIFRAGRLPSGMPDWFKELDVDNDGQVALFEWRRGGKALDEFAQWDLNDDGIITIEEVLRAQGRSMTQLAKEASGEGAPTSPSMFAGGANPFAGGGKGGGAIEFQFGGKKGKKGKE